MTTMSNEPGVIAIIRMRATKPERELFDALVTGGVRSLEVTLPTPGSVDAIGAWAGTVPDVRVGAGTVRTAEDVTRALDAGAEFLVTPTFSIPVLDAAASGGVPVYCGATTPTECDAAWRHPAVVGVKVFPAAALGGPSYIKALGEPLDDIRLVPTGGVDIEAARTYSFMGCAGIGVGGQLVNEEIVSEGRFDELTRRSAAFVKAWVDGREGRRK